MAPARPFPVDPQLTAIAIGYSNPANSLIANDVLPEVQVGAEKFSWTEYPIADAFTVPDTRVGRAGRVNRVTFTGEERTASTNDYGLEDPIPLSDIEEAERARAENRSNYDPEAHGIMMLTDLLLLAKELRAASTVQDPANYAPERREVLTGTDRFSDYVNSKPIQVIKAAINGTLIYRPNVMSMGPKVWEFLSSHPALVNAIRGNLTSEGIVTREQVARLFEIQKVVVGEGYVNTAKPGQDPVLGRAWGNSIQLTYVNPVVSTQRGITWGYTAKYGSRIAGRIIDPNVGLDGGVVIRSGEKCAEIVAARDVGFQIANVVEEL